VRSGTNIKSVQFKLDGGNLDANIIWSECNSPSNDLSVGFFSGLDYFAVRFNARRDLEAFESNKSEPD